MPFNNTIKDMLDFFIRGGFFMALLLILSIVSLTIIFQRALTLRINEVIPEPLKKAIHSFQLTGTLETISKAIINDNSPLGRILQTLLKHASWPRIEALDALQVAARHEVARLESGLVLLEITTGIAPLLGLLGTLSGLVGIFANLGEKGDPQMIALGISQALNSTIIGLAVAVPSLIAYHYFSRRVEILAIEMEALTADVMTKIYLSGDRR